MSINTFTSMPPKTFNQRPAIFTPSIIQQSTWINFRFLTTVYCLMPLLTLYYRILKSIQSTWQDIRLTNLSNRIYRSATSLTSPRHLTLNTPWLFNQLTALKHIDLVIARLQRHGVSKTLCCNSGSLFMGGWFMYFIYLCMILFG